MAGLVGFDQKVAIGLPAQSEALDVSSAPSMVDAFRSGATVMVITLGHQGHLALQPELRKPFVVCLLPNA